MSKDSHPRPRRPVPPPKPPSPAPRKPSREPKAEAAAASDRNPTVPAKSRTGRAGASKMAAAETRPDTLAASAGHNTAHTRKSIEPAAREGKSLAHLLGFTTNGSGTAGDHTANRGGRYEILRELGQGGMGAVFACFDHDLRREVAMKVMHHAARSPDALARFLEEAQVTGQLEHPNIIPIYDVGLDAQEQLFITMKLVRGHSLKEVISAAKRKIEQGVEPEEAFPLFRRLDIFHKVCDAIAYAHEHGVLHRDLKPDNIMVGDHGEVLVMDWGLAKLRAATSSSTGADNRSLVSAEPAASDSAGKPVTSDRATEALALTLEGTLAGTPAYMSPEQARGDNDEVDHRADVYQLGAILRELLTFALPYSGKTFAEVLTQARTGQLLAPSERVREAHKPWIASRIRIPREIEAIAVKASAAHPEQRYQSAAELRDDVVAYQANEPVSVYTDRLDERLYKWARRKPTTAVALILVLIFGSLVAAGGSTARTIMRDQARVSELQIAEEQRRTAEEQRRAAVERAEREEAQRREAQRAEQLAMERAEREEAQRRAEQEDIRRAFVEGRLEEVQEMLGLEIEVRRSEALLEILSWTQEAAERGESAVEYFRQIEDARVIRLMRELRSFIAANQATGQDYVTAEDLSVLGMLYAYRLDQTEEALEMFEQAQELNPLHPTPFHNRAVLLYNLGRYEEAVADFTRAMELDPYRADSRSHRALAYASLGRYDEALEDANRACAQAPRLVYVYAHRARILQMMGRYEEALRDVEEALSLLPNARPLRRHRGLLYLDLEQWTRAAGDFTWLLERETHPESIAFALSHRGWAIANAGYPNEAIEDFEHAGLLDPVMALPYKFWGRMHLNRGEPQAALEPLKEARDRAPGNSYTYMLLGRAYLQIGEDHYEDAVQMFDRAIELEPGYSAAYANRGRVYASLEEYEKALADLEESLRLGRLQPSEVWIIEVTRGMCLTEVGRLDEAYQQLTACLEQAAPSQRWWPKLGLAENYAAREQWDEAISYATQARQGASEQGYASAVERIDELLEEFEQSRGATEDDDD